MDELKDSPARKTAAARLILPLLLALGLIAIAFYASSLKDRDNPPVLLSDGTRIEFLGTAKGNSPFTTEKKWEKLARQYLPARWTKKLRPVISGACGSDQNSLTIYLLVEGRPGGAQQAPPWQGGYEATDKEGFRYERDTGSCSFTGGPGKVIYGLTLRAFPRRQRQFRFDLLDGKSSRMASFTVTNPFEAKNLEWTPEPIPQTKTNGPVVLTLTGLESRQNALHPSWKLTSTSRFWAKARARWYTLSDAPGNVSQNLLSPKESAWKLSTYVYREESALFAPEERVVLENIGIPSPGQFLELDKRHSIGDLLVEVQLLSSPGELVITNSVTRDLLPFRKTVNSTTTYSDGTRVERISSESYFLLMTVTGAEPHDELQLEIADDQGRQIESRNSGYSIVNSTRVYRREIRPAPDAKSLTLEARISRPLLFEFLVAPPKDSGK